MPSIDFFFPRTQTDFPRGWQHGHVSRVTGSAPTQIGAPVKYPTAPASLFLPISVELFPGDHPPNDDPVPPPSTPSPSGTTYDAAIARLEQMVSDSTLTATQRNLLDAIMTTAQMFVAPGEVHRLLHTILSGATLTPQILDLVNTTTLGMRAFAAQARHSEFSVLSGKRNDIVSAACASRDRSTCIVTARRAGECCHIIPKAADFWAFVAMFTGQSGMHQIRRMTLAPRPFSTNNLFNVLWLSPEVHKAWDEGQLALVPIVSAAPYNPAAVAEVSCPPQYAGQE